MSENITLREVYEKIICKMKRFSDQPEENYNLIALWIIGTYYHKDFTTYPYLYFNAMKGSGKTRILNLIKSMSYEGKVFNNLSESSLFRTANKGHTICIDEFESMTAKENSSLREILNSGYKKGSIVMRMKKYKNKEGEGYEPEEFSLFCPIAMANISGIDNTVEDRCITLVLDKTDDKKFSLLIEDFETCPDVLFIKESLEVLTDFSVVSGVSGVCECQGGMYSSKDYPKMIRDWNIYILYTLTTLNNSTLSEATLPVPINEVSSVVLEFFQNITKSGLNSRQLEISFPLLYLARVLGEDIFSRALGTLMRISDDKKMDDTYENRDSSFLMFLSEQEPTGEFVPISEITIGFRSWQREEWMNEKWVGKALRRLNLVIEKRRMSYGMEVRIRWVSVKMKSARLNGTEDSI